MHALALDDLTLRRAQHGEPRAWRALVEMYQRPIHGLIWRLVSGRAPDRDDDLVQETFVRILRSIAKFDPRGPATLQTWMLTIATRLALNELRRIPTSEYIESIGHDRTDAQSERARLGRRIARAMAALPDEQRAIVVLAELEELTYEEIAEATGVAVGTVKSRLSRARAALEAQLGDLR